MPFALPQLPYSPEQLAPGISAQTLGFHHGKHHQAYVNNLNQLVVGTRFEDATLDTIVRESEGAIFNNGAQVWNHTFYFEALSPRPQSAPAGGLAGAIHSQFGSLGELKEQLGRAAVTLFGSGWAWLSLDPQGRLTIAQEANAGNPMRQGLTPLLTCDVWEHAYYLDYQNRRAEYFNAFWELLDWRVVEQRFGR